MIDCCRRWRRYDHFSPTSQLPDQYPLPAIVTITLNNILLGLAGRSREEAAACDVVVDILFDLYDHCERVIMTESDPRKKVHYSCAATETNCIRTE